MSKMTKVLVILIAVLFVFGLLYWWFVPWRLARSYKISGLKEVNPDSSALLAKGRRVLAITGHVDDLEFFCGGTMARLQEQGAKVWLVVGTEDYKWYYSTRAAAEKNTMLRKQEQADVANYFHYRRVVYLGYPDFRLETNDESIDKVTKIIEDFRPDAILTFDPVNGSSIQHRDHTAAGIIALEAAKKSQTRADIFMFTTAKPNFYVDVTNTIDQKWKALGMYNSVFGRRDFMFGELKNWAKQAGKKAGVDYAESYHVVRIHVKLDEQVRLPLFLDVYPSSDTSDKFFR